MPDFCLSAPVSENSQEIDFKLLMNCAAASVLHIDNRKYRPVKGTKSHSDELDRSETESHAEMTPDVAFERHVGQTIGPVAIHYARHIKARTNVLLEVVAQAYTH